jgi:hypothetical protein
MHRKTLFAFLLFVLLCGIALPFAWNLFKEPSDVRASVIQASSGFESRGGDSDGGGDGWPGALPPGQPPDLLGPDDAAFVRYANAARREFAPAAGEKPRYAADELAKRIFEEAERRKLTPEGTPAGQAWESARSSVGQRAKAEVPEAERAGIVRLLDVAIHEVGERVAISLAEQSVLRHVDAEAALRVTHQDLLQLVPLGGLVPEDPLTLLPPEQLDGAIGALRPPLRALEERQAVYDTAEVKAAVAHLKARIDHYTSVRGSPAYAEFHKDGAGLKALSRQVSKQRWDAARGDFDARVKAEAVRLRAQEAAVPGREEIVRYVHFQRGPPPDSPAARLLDAVRYFDADVGTALRCQARVEAALSDLRSQLPPAHPLLRLGGYQRLLGALSDADFYQFKHLVSLLQFDNADKLPGSTERSFYTEQWAEAVNAEVARRGVRDGPVERFYEDARVVRLVDQQLRGRETSPGELARAKYLAAAQLRFPDHRTMPVAVKEEVGRLVNAAIDAYRQRLEGAREAYERVAARVAKGTGPVDVEVAAKLPEFRNALKKLVLEYRDYVWTAEDRQVAVKPEVREHLDTLLVWFFGPAPPPPPPSPDGPVSPLPRGPPGNPPGSGPQSAAGELVMALSGPQSGGQAGRPLARPMLLLSDPAVLRAADQVDELGKSLQAKVDLDSTDPPRFAVEKDRYTVARSKLTPEMNWSGAGQWEKDITRLPDSEANWEGRLKTAEAGGSKKSPFDFEREVWQFKSFRSVGGGIHFGATGHRAGPSLKGYVLRYDLKRQELVLTGAGAGRGAAPTVFRLRGVTPEVLKPLYQFVAAGRNAAVSIGWGMERTASPFSRSRDQAVLLDPFLVDTPVGRDLVLADTIPWAYHTKKIGPATFYEAFGKLKDQSDSETGKLLDEVFQNPEPYRASAVNDWALKHPEEFGEGVLGILSRAVLESANPEQARERFVAILAVRLARLAIDKGLESANLAKTGGESTEELRDGVKRLTEAGLNFKSFPKGEFESSDTYAERAVPELVRAESEHERKWVQETIDSQDAEGEGAGGAAAVYLRHKLKMLFGKSDRQYDQAILGELYEQLRIGLVLPKGCNKELLRFWVAAAVAAEKSADGDKLRQDLILFLTRGQTALAVLMDQPNETQIELAEGKITLRGKMQYRYARTRIVVRDDRVYFGKVPDDDREVDSLDGLNEIVNTHYSQIEAAFPPLQRVARYAELAAFLRWAVKSVEAGELGGIDFSELADVPARNRKEFATPDVLTP